MASADILRAAHSPLPWTAHAYAVFGPQRCLATCDLIGFDGNAVNEANAAFIVRACNAHYQMLEALKAVVRVADRNTAEFDLARAAIAAAEREAGQ